MGLLSTEVEVVLAGNNVKWYENKGYILPRRYDKRGRFCLPKNSKLLVKVEDLPLKSHVMVDVQCDCCDKKYSIVWSDYNIQLHDGKIYCKSCAHSILLRGKNHPNWNPNLSNEDRIKGRDYIEYNNFIKRVLARDNYTCQCCGNRADVVHHLDGYDWCIEKRTDESNGISLCNNCHKNFHSMYGYGKNTKEQFEEWIGGRSIILDTYKGDIPTARWAYCVTDNELIKNIVTYAKEHGLDYSPIYRCCDGNYPVYHNKIFLWYDEYILLSEKEITKIIKEREQKILNQLKERQVVCVNYKLLFDSQINGSKYLNVNKTGISLCCNGHRTNVYENKNHEKLIWKFAKDVDDIENYTYISKEECEKAFLARNQESSNDGSFIM